MPGMEHLFLFPRLTEGTDDWSFGSGGNDSARRVKWFDTWECEQGAWKKKKFHSKSRQNKPLKRGDTISFTRKIRVPVIEIGDSSMPSWLSFKEDNLCQKPSSTELWKGANWRTDPFLCPAILTTLNLSSFFVTTEVIFELSRWERK